ncbi:deoxyribonuclease V [Actinomadura rupiterrae]|uniref:deoxyribonuclease V n=1 Tax=Actinomadura rupiterrae TaxID=559627 RepID=UPI0020A43840|nr:deoxyribonuclease V [Actinomadura rupiterrae]MCP2339621.1 deoxyribonuclease V [Actinomadura rupiterrae]
MEITVPHAWPATPDEAEAIQHDLRGQVVASGTVAPRTVAGLDVSYAGDGHSTHTRVAAAAVVLDASSLEVLEESVAVGTSDFPYVPGLFAFRELPTLVEALRGLSITPDLLVCDGYGLAHPRRFGLACHVGIITGLPAIGIAKTAFVGTHEPPGPKRGDRSPLLIDGAEVGSVLRTQDGVKPVFVSVGHRVGLDEACRLALALAPGYRLPETTRRADRLSRDRLATA